MNIITTTKNGWNTYGSMYDFAPFIKQWFEFRMSKVKLKVSIHIIFMELFGQIRFLRRFLNIIK